jgi:hypothetical protein
VIVEHHPRALRRIALSLAALLVVAFGVIALFLPNGQGLSDRVAVGDQLAFFGIGLLLAVGVVAFTRFRVRADERGIWVRNVVGERFFPWGVVVGVDIPRGSTWAQLELHDDEVVGLLAVQTSDGDAAVDTVLALRELLKQAQR